MMHPFLSYRSALLALIAAGLCVPLAHAAPAGSVGTVRGVAGLPAAPAPTLRPDDLNAGLHGLDARLADRPFYEQDQFRYEFGGPKDDDCRKRRHGDDDYCRRPVSMVPEPSTYLLGTAGLLAVLGIQSWRRRRRRAAAGGRSAA